MNLKIMIASDIHGSLTAAQAMKERYETEKAGRLVLLGDLLYHGPRNDLPAGYDPKGVTALLNGMKHEICCVRGNCDAEVDQMVLAFPILADYMLLYPQALDGRMVFVTHGHLYHAQSMPLIKRGDILLHGHTHVPAAVRQEGYVYLNPGSIALPKEGHPPTYMIYENGVFTLKDLTGKEWLALEV